MLKVAAAFSPSMVFPEGARGAVDVSFQVISEDTAKFKLEANPDFESYVGHEDTAKILSQRLGVEIPARRTALTLDVDEELLVCLPDLSPYLGRLKEGVVLSAEEIASLNMIYIIVRVERKVLAPAGGEDSAGKRS